MDSLLHPRPRLPLKRASRACIRCHERKVRCDGALTGFPCTNCRLDRNPCRIFRARQRKAAKPEPPVPSSVDITFSAEDALARVRPKSSHGRTTSSLPVESTTWLSYSSYPSLSATGLLHLDPEQVQNLHGQGCLDVPGRSVVLSIMRYYFLFVHPCLPLVDEGEFMHSLEMSLGAAGQIPLLLFQAMLFAASCFIPVDVSRRCGYDSLLSARNDFYTKAKILYESRVEQDALAISQAAVLLSHFTSDQEPYANSGWLHIAVRHAMLIQAHQYHCIGPATRRAELKRLWWCCLIRDRIIALGMRRPLQIPKVEPGVCRHLLSPGDVLGKTVGLLSYSPRVKHILSQTMRCLCHFVITVTDLVALLYPQQPRRAECDARSGHALLRRLDEARFTLHCWEMEWMAHLEGDYTALHPNITLFCNLVGIYYQSARIALCNKVCSVSVLSKSPFVNVENVQDCQLEICSATERIVSKIRQLKTLGLTGKLPISAAACTLLPEILLSISNSCAVLPGERTYNHTSRAMLSEVHSLMQSKVHSKLGVNLISQALSLFERCRHGCSPRPDGDDDDHRLFGLSKQRVSASLDIKVYVALVRFIDLSLSTEKVTEQNLTSCSPADNRLLRAVQTPGDTQSCAAAEHPVWMEALGDFFFGQGAQLRIPSPVLVPDTLCWAADAEGYAEDWYLLESLL